VNVRTNSILAASILGTVFFSFVTVVSTAVTYGVARQIIATIAYGGNPLADYSLGMALFVNGLTCGAWVVVGVGSGFLYPYFHRKETELPPIETAVVGGFCSGIIVGIVGAVIYSFVQVFVILPMNQQMIAIMATSDPEMWLSTMRLGFKTGFNLLFNGILVATIFSIFGAIGGGFGKLFLGQPPKPQKTPVS
jgi:hypothetical protein